MVLDGGITLAFIIGTAAISTFNAGLNFYRWITGPDIRVPNRSNDNMREPLPQNVCSYIIYSERSMEVYKKIIIDVDRIICKSSENITNTPITTIRANPSVFNSDSSDDEVIEHNMDNIKPNKHLDVISFSNRVPPRSNEAIIKRYRVEHYVFPSETFKYNNITLTPLRTNGYITGIEISSEKSTELSDFMKKYIETCDTLAFEN